MGYNAVQKQVLEALLDQYERSKTYQGENKVIQSFQIPPEKVFPDYASDYADMDQIRDFEAWMRELEQDGLITIRYGSGEIRKLTADPESWDLYYEVLQRRDKLSLQQDQIMLYQRYLGMSPLLDRFCRERSDVYSKIKIHSMEGRKQRPYWSSANSFYRTSRTSWRGSCRWRF